MEQSNPLCLKKRSILIVLVMLAIFAVAIGSIDLISKTLVQESFVVKFETISQFSTVSPDFIEAGMGFSNEFDVDDSGNIYFVAHKSEKNWIYKVSEEGKLLSSFGRIGQGPGEVEYAICPAVLGNEKIAITDWNKKIAIYDMFGKLIKEIIPSHRFLEAVALNNGNILFQRSTYSQNRPDQIKRELVLADNKFDEIQILDSLYEHFDIALHNLRYPKYFVWEATADRVYTANEDRGYEILVYDLSGKLLRKIKKETKGVKVTEGIMNLVLERSNETQDRNRYFPNPLPPINHFFPDDEGHVFVMTYAKDPRSGFYLYDIFDTDGTYMGSQGIQTIWARQYFANMGIVAKNGKLYKWQEDADGNWIFKIDKIIWTSKSQEN